MKIKWEPAMVTGAFTAAIALLVGYGLLDLKRAGLWEALVVALLPLAQAFFTRQQVVPVQKIEDAGMSVRDINLKAGNAP